MKRLFLSLGACVAIALSGCATTGTQAPDYVALAKQSCATANAQIAALQSVDELLPVADSQAVDKIASAVTPVCLAVDSIQANNAQAVYTALLQQLPGIVALGVKYGPVIAGAL